jgi:hypothetical protein
MHILYLTLISDNIVYNTQIKLGPMLARRGEIIFEAVVFSSTWQWWRQLWLLLMQLLF